MRNLHCSGRFLRFLRSIGAKTACARRAIVALFVVVATILATFMIAPTYALSAGEGAGEKVSTEKAEGEQSGSAKSEGENKQQPKQSEPNSTEINQGNNTESSSTLTNNNNKESKPVEKQNPDSNKVDDKAKDDEAAVKKNAKDTQKKDASAKAVNGTDRSTKGEPQLHPECKGKYNTPEKCYSITYANRNIVNIKGDNDRPYTKVHQIFKPTIEVAGNKQETLPADVWLELEKFKSDDSVNYAFFKGENDKNDSYTAKSTKKVTNSDGSIRFFPSKWLKTGKSYKFNVVIHYPDGSESKAKKIIARLDKKDLPKPKSDDLKLSLYDFENADSTAKKDNDNKSVSITIKPKSNTQGADKKDTYDPINKLFIDSKSIYKRGELYHHMICKDDANNYTVDNFNGLSLKDKKDNPSADNQTKFKHMDGENRPSKDAADSAVYENDDYIERSQSWISGTPTSAGTFECRVFAFKNAELTDKASGKHPSNLVEEFKKNSKTNEGKKSLFGGNIVDSNTWKTDNFKQGIDWDYKPITIEVKSSEPPKPEPPTIGDNDLTLKVYPFKNNDSGSGGASSALADGDTVSVMKGIELKPFIEATSEADSTKEITLKMLCSKGEKPQGSSAEVAGSVSGEANTVTTANDGLVYNNWQSPEKLGFDFPDNKQDTCKSEEGKQSCTPSGSTKSFAATVNASATFMSTEDGYYKCVVYALKPDALAKFNGVTTNVTPDTLLAAFNGANPNLKASIDYAKLAMYIHVSKDFTLPNAGERNWNLQLGAVAAVMVSVLAAGFVISQSEACRKLLCERRRC